MGSQVSFISESILTLLNLPRNACKVPIEGVGSSFAALTKGIVTVSMQSMVDASFTLNFSAYILDSITSATPSVSVDISSWSHMQGLQLADPTLGTPNAVDHLIGADILPALILTGIRSGPDNMPCALRTRLGWVVFGPVASSECISTFHHSFMAPNPTDDICLDKLLCKFWEMEEPAVEVSSEDDECETIFVNTVTRLSDGRYCVQIPFRPDAPSLGNSHQAALRQFYQLERKLATDSHLRERYVQFMREYVTLGHMEAIEADPHNFTQCYYIPHHAVTEKFRVVFNASSKSTNGVSLNDTHFSGRQLQDNLVDILHRFRRFEVAITADIKKMFRQVWVDQRHRKWQQILWRESPNEPLQTYRLNTVTYGMACSPYNAIRALIQCAIDNTKVIADASRAAAARNSILKCFYVDDYLDSVENANMAVTRAQDVSMILQQGGFELAKWNSNCSRALAKMSNSTPTDLAIDLGDHDTKVLGLHWNPVTDNLFFKTKVCDELHITKRIILRDIARLYDLTGMLAPVVVLAKIMIQMLWKAQLNWDTPITTELREKWLNFRSNLPALERIRIPRWLGLTHNTSVTLHGFCDASICAYAAAIYVRCIDLNGHPKVMLVAAKTRVAPLKQQTIPRLELCAAQLLTSTLASVKRALNLEGVAYTLWSDSTIVLNWIKKPPSTFKQYVANRVAYIQTHSDTNAWTHVRSELNPADCASRGITPAVLETHTLWWTGPAMIRSFDEAKPTTPSMSTEQQQIFSDETRSAKVLLSVHSKPLLLTTTFNNKQIPLVLRFSRLSRLLNTTARIRRILPCFQTNRHNEVVTAEEREWALEVHIRQSQGNAFISDINALKSCSRLNSSSKLLPLNPFLDDRGILRLGGRLTHSDLPPEQRHPIILARDCALAALLIHEAHLYCLHGGIQATLQHLRQKFWIIHSRTLVKSYIHRCVACRRYQRVTQQQQMASLPKSRVLVSPPFTHTGLDYCGPFNVRIGGKRSQTTSKCYAAIFICMATKAVHIELAEDLSAQAFIEVFDRFISRRGISSVMYSDNGTQFVGASRQMQRDLEEWVSDRARQHIATTGTRWKFITPSAPHHGGLWEAAVRSAKKHLYRTIGRQTLRFNQLSTLLVKIEAVLNSRPLVPLHDDPNGCLAITPADFLIGRPLNSRPEKSVPDIPQNRLLYRQLLQQMFEHFWKRWQREYLSTLQARNKWARSSPNLHTGDVVLILNENLPPSYWRIGRILDVHPGKDGLVRTVTIEYNSDKKSAEGLFIKHKCQRPVQKLCRLVEVDVREPILNREGSAGQDV